MRTSTLTADTAASRPTSFLSKVSTTFNSRKRNLAEFCIETDEPYRQYSPGDIVKGCVNIKVDKAINITHLVVCLHGYVKVFNTARVPGQSVPRDGAPVGTGNQTGKKGAEYFGNGFASLFENEVALCGQGRLLPGKYQFKFELELPSTGMPTSIDVGSYWTHPSIPLTVSLVRARNNLLHAHVDTHQTYYNVADHDMPLENQSH